MNKIDVDLSVAYRLLNPGCVLLVSVGDGTRDNVFAATWNMPVYDEPAFCAFACAKGHHSYSFIEATGEVVLNVPDLSLVDAVYGCGSTSGRDIDKFARFGLRRRAGRLVRAPLIDQCVASLECRVEQTIDVHDSALLLLKVVRAEACSAHFRSGRWQFDRGLGLIHHVSGAQFCVSDRMVEARKP